MQTDTQSPSVKYRINPVFVAPDPTPADLFSFRDDPGAEGRATVLDELGRYAHEHGIAQARVTLIEAGDGSVYPPGIWFEGWMDRKARQLPFGTPWPTPESAIWPPLTAVDPTND